ncbi:hypothetical protein D3C80_2159310 [compost metagenome]
MVSSLLEDSTKLRSNMRSASSRRKSTATAMLGARSGSVNEVNCFHAGTPSIAATS